MPSQTYPNKSSTAMRHPGTAGSASAVSPRRKITGRLGSLALYERLYGSGALLPR
jgi:hypothetical protein